MQIFSLANICRNRINYKLEITGLMGFHAIAVDRAIGFLSDRHHRTVSAWQNPPYFSTYLTYSSFSTSVSQPLPGFLSILLFPAEEIPAPGCLRTAGHHLPAQPSGQWQYRPHDQWIFKHGSIAWGKTSHVEAARRAVGQHKAKPSNAQEHAGSLCN